MTDTTHAQQHKSSSSQNKFMVDVIPDSEEESMVIEEPTLNVCLYMYGRVNVHQFLWLVDSGSTVSIIAYKT